MLRPEVPLERAHEAASSRPFQIHTLIADQHVGIDRILEELRKYGFLVTQGKPLAEITPAGLPKYDGPRAHQRRDNADEDDGTRITQYA